MTLRRATLYAGGASLLIAWFSSAASLSLERNPRRPVPAAPDASPTEAVAGQIQAQARRLKERIAAAPLPQRPSRNPFVFRSAPAADPPRARRADVEPVRAAVTEEPGFAEPVLILVGMAEQRTRDGVVRTAMITSDGVDVIMAVVGTSVLGRYKVTAVGPDAVDLADASTGRARRLALQDH